MNKTLPVLIFSSGTAKSNISKNETKRFEFPIFSGSVLLFYSHDLCDICPHTKAVLMTSKCAYQILHKIFLIMIRRQYTEISHIKKELTTAYLVFSLISIVNDT